MAAVTINVRIAPSAQAPTPTPPTVARHVREVVVPLDGTTEAERAVPVAAALAGELGARLHLLTTADDLPESSPGAYLERVASGVNGEVETDVALDQEPVATIVEHSGHEDTAVCMATHARGRLLGALHVGVTDGVLHDARGPVVLVGPHCATTALGDGPVVLAHDGSLGCTESSAPLVELAAALHRPVRIVRVAVAPSGKAADRPYASTDEAIAPLLELAGRLGVPAEERIVFGTNVVESLLASANGASMIALATHGRRGMDRFRQGSITMSVAHAAAVPVVARHLDAHPEP